MEKLICFPPFVHLPCVLAQPAAVRIELTLAASPAPGRSLVSEELRNVLSRGSSRPLDEVAAASLPASPWAASWSRLMPALTACRTAVSFIGALVTLNQRLTTLLALRYGAVGVQVWLSGLLAR